MPKKQLPAPDADTLRNAINRFTRQGDRGTALIAAAWLDDALAALIRAQFRPDKSVTDDFMRSDGPLGSFSARIKVAYLLDLIGPSMRFDLDLIRAIRNQFAHSRSEIRFSTASVRDRCNVLRGAIACGLGGWALRSPKHKFVVTSYFLTECLLSTIKARKRNPLLDSVDSYATWIRWTVRRGSLHLLAEQLERV